MIVLMEDIMVRRTSSCLPSLVLLASFAVVATGFAQTPAPASAPAEAQTPTTDPDAAIVTAPDHPQSKEELVTAAWKLLEDAVADEKHIDIRIQGLAALGTMGRDPHAAKLISAAYADKEVDVRTAAVLASGQTHNRALIPGLHKLLNDPEPLVAFTAASTLWKMGDHSGEDLLSAVVDGDRKATAGLMHGSMHAANRELHDPAALAKVGAMQGASMLLGPFGFGITAYEYIKRNGGGDSPRVVAIEEISQQHSPAVKKELLGAVTDKDPGVRAAAAKALRSYHEPDASHALAMLFIDPKKPVECSGAAAYLISVGVVALPPPVPLQP
jgi:HEAT repeat protein